MKRQNKKELFGQLEDNGHVSIQLVSLQWRDVSSIEVRATSSGFHSIGFSSVKRHKKGIDDYLIPGFPFNWFLFSEETGVPEKSTLVHLGFHSIGFSSVKRPHFSSTRALAYQFVSIQLVSLQWRDLFFSALAHLLSEVSIQLVSLQWRDNAKRLTATESLSFHSIGFSSVKRLDEVGSQDPAATDAVSIQLVSLQWRD